jgi:DnaJ-class molecular chaperone
MKLPFVISPIVKTVACPSCKGTGRTAPTLCGLTDPCSFCHGTSIVCHGKVQDYNDAIASTKEKS